jgi:hypothetical protein
VSFSRSFFLSSIVTKWSAAAAATIMMEYSFEENMTNDLWLF